MRLARRDGFKDQLHEADTMWIGLRISLMRLHLGHYVTKQQCTSDLDNALVSCAQSATG